MGKRMKLPFPFIKSTQLDQQWQWPSCVNSPNTLSFRSSSATTGDMFKTINSAYEEMCTTTTESSSPQLGNPVDDDSVIQEVMQSERLFFTPGETNSILEEAKTKKKQNGFVGIKNVVMEEMESANPYVDFRKSMEEMVETNEGLKGSMEGLQKLLSCYLRINERDNHGYIVGAFVDLLTNLSFFDDQEEDENNQNQYHNNNDLSSSSNSPISAMSFTSYSSSTCTSSTARNTTPCSEGGGSSSSSSKKTLVVVENNASPCCSSQV